MHRDPARVEVLKPPTLGVPVLVEPTLMCRALVGLEDVEVVGVIGWTVPLQVHIASRVPRPACVSCGTPARVKQTMRRRLVDLPVFGRPVRRPSTQTVRAPCALLADHERWMSLGKS